MNQKKFNNLYIESGYMTKKKRSLKWDPTTHKSAIKAININGI